MDLPAEILFIVVGVCFPQRALAPSRQASTDLVTKLCHKKDIINLRAVSRKFNEICEPIIYRLLAQEIVTRRHFHLHRAVSSRRMSSILRLIQNGASLTQTDTAGETPLHIASRNDYIAGVETLMRCKGDIDVPTPHGWTALQLAARHGHEEIVDILLRNGADPNICGFHGWTALHYAARSGHRKVVEVLIGAGARIDVLDNDGKSPVHAAQAFGQREVLAIFQCRLMCF